MMNQLLEDYKEYYHLRAYKYASYPHFKRTFHAEQQLALALELTNDLTHFSESTMELENACRKAKLLDQAEQQAAFYLKNDEPLLANLYQRMFNYLENTTDDENTSNQQLIAFEKEKTHILLLDQLTINAFLICFPYLKRYIAERDALPATSSMYKSHQEAIVKEEKSALIHLLQSELQLIQNEYPEAAYQWDCLLSEKRHRRRISLSDERLKYYIEEIKNVL